MKPAQKQFRTGFSLWCLLQVMLSAVRRKEFSFPVSSILYYIIKSDPKVIVIDFRVTFLFDVDLCS